MFRLRKKRPPFGTVMEPLWEYTYGEQVKVVDGFCDVKSEAARDYLLKTGYEEIVNDSVDEPEEVPRDEAISVGVKTKVRPQQAKAKWRR